ncbi:MAG: hypothetical protein EOP84_31675 [Verrucomicrobiaceae bacterium]|nr:MAG: hypothetical protein EOP84_31675 [Verrucomicrobiaceae bacterium]
MIPSNAAIAEYGEQVSSFLRRASSKAEGTAALNAHSSTLLEHLSALLPTIKESSAYAGVAFYGRFQAVNLRLIKKLASDNVPSVKALEAIRTGKALRVAASAKVGWDLLLKEDPNALWAAIYLNLCLAPVSVRVAKVKAEIEDGETDNEETEDDDETNETEEDEDDAN